MIQRVAHKNTAQDVADRIAAAIRPWRIVLFGSRARGDARSHSDYDFYVEIEAKDDDRLHDVHDRILTLLRDTSEDFDFKVCRRGDLEDKRDDPGTIEWDVAREGTVLYAHPGASTDIAPPPRVGEPSRDRPESVDMWLRAAEHDLEARGVLQESGHDHWAMICWLSHQTCEKHLRALLVSRHVRPQRTHKLRNLLRALRGSRLELAGLDADCRLLTKHAITPRYPAGLKLGPEDARLASAAADRVVTAVRALLPPERR